MTMSTEQGEGRGKRYLLAGGGTGGPVGPLLAVAAELKRREPDAEFLLVGVPDGPERQMAEGAGIPFRAMRAAKLRRYLSWRNITDLFVFLGSLLAARKILAEFRPDWVVSASGFAGVPLCWMGRLMGARILVHQQDVQVSLTYRLVAPVAHAVTCVFEETVPHLKAGAQAVGNPVRPEFLTPADPGFPARAGIQTSLPLVLVVGGATGAQQLNDAVREAVPRLAGRMQVVHVTGSGKSLSDFARPNYFSYEFLGADYPDFMKAAAIVVSRAGLGSIAELSALGKPAVIVPMPGSHQERNGDLLRRRHAAVVLQGDEFTAQGLVSELNRLLDQPGLMSELAENISGLMPHDAAARIVQVIQSHSSHTHAR